MQHSIEVMRLCVSRWLAHIRHLYEIEQAVEAIRESAALSGVHLDGQPTGSGSAIDAMAETITRILELEEELQAQTAEVDKVRKLCNTTPRRICWLRYVEQQRWTQVRKIVGYSQTHVRILMLQGITELYEFTPEEYRRSLPNAAPE